MTFRIAKTFQELVLVIFYGAEGWPAAIMAFSGHTHLRFYATMLTIDMLLSVSET